MEEIDNNLNFIINPEPEEYFYGNSIYPIFKIKKWYLIFIFYNNNIQIFLSFGIII